MRDYATAYREFSVAELERRVLGQRLDEGLNVTVACCDRWAGEDRVALEFVARDFTRERVSFRQLQSASARFANLLAARGIGRGDVVAGLLPHP
jgi:acetyl-CoA synthetase